MTFDNIRKKREREESFQKEMAAKTPFAKQYFVESGVEQLIQKLSEAAGEPLPYTVEFPDGWAVIKVIVKNYGGQHTDYFTISCSYEGKMYLLAKGRGYPRRAYPLPTELSYQEWKNNPALLEAMIEYGYEDPVTDYVPLPPPPRYPWEY